MSKDTFCWTDELVVEFTTWSLKDSPTFQGRYADIEQFKQSKSIKEQKDWETFSFDYLGNIYRVQRISDREEFIVGEIVGCVLNDDKFKIEKIDVSTGECYFMATGHLLPLRNAKKLPPTPQPEQPKERIVISEVGEYEEMYPYGLYYQFLPSKNIHPDKFPAIKAAIEAVLNDDAKQYWETMDRFFPDKKYTDADLKQAQELAFHAGRRPIRNIKKIIRESERGFEENPFYFPTFESYLNSKQ